MLPYDIAINSIREVKPEAHARFDATSRTYEYRISRVKNPFLDGLCYYNNKPLDILAMNKAADLLIGQEQDFESFSKVKTEVNNFRCTITKAIWDQKENNLVFHISANRFLRGMVRAIVGTLLEVGLKRRTIEDFAQVIADKNRTKAGSAAPAKGLFLTSVVYPDSIFE